MTVFWLSFRIADDVQHRPTYEQRYKALVESVHQAITGKYWHETTSFIVFESSRSIEKLAEKFELAIEPRYDHFLIREMNTKSALVCGRIDDKDIFELMPYLKKV